MSKENKKNKDNINKKRERQTDRETQREIGSVR